MEPQTTWNLHGSLKIFSMFCAHCKTGSPFLCVEFAIFLHVLLINHFYTLMDNLYLTAVISLWRRSPPSSSCWRHGTRDANHAL